MSVPPVLFALPQNGEFVLGGWAAAARPASSVARPRRCGRSSTHRCSESCRSLSTVSLPRLDFVFDRNAQSFISLPPSSRTTWARETVTEPWPG